MNQFTRIFAFQCARVASCRTSFLSFLQHTKEQYATKAQSLSGMPDCSPQTMVLRQHLIETVVSVFQQHGGEPLDTPVVECSHILQSKYGAQSVGQLFYLEKTGDLQYDATLRYDLTVPFARYLAQNNIRAMRRYQLGKVYRRDFVSLTRGRYREFLQCDFDIAGELDVMTADAECVVIIDEILKRLPMLGAYLIRVNHRGLLDGLLTACGVPVGLHKTTLASVDKLDKCSWKEIRHELVCEKNIPEVAVDQLHHFVCRAPEVGPKLIKELLSNELLAGQPVAMKALADLDIFFTYVAAYGLDEQHVRLDLGLARGLDYYTGLIYEAVLTEGVSTGGKEPIGVGSVAGGGRYDELVGMFCGRKVPCVGLSLGVERILSVIMERRQMVKVRTSKLQVFVCNAHKGLLKERMHLCAELWRAGLRAGHSCKAGWKLLSQLQYCENRGIPLAVIIGDEENASGMVRLRVVGQRGIQSDYLLSRKDLVFEIEKKLQSIAVD